MKILGIDYGRKKMGIAMGDTITKLSEPLKVLSSSKFKKPLSRNSCGIQILKLVEENNIGRIIIGLPEGELGEEIKKIGAGLEKQARVRVEFFDETLTTQEAQRLLIVGGRKRKSRKQMEDAVAAAIMLQYYLEGVKEEAND